MPDVSKTALFGRAWELTINTASEAITISSSAWEPEALRIVFEVEMGIGQTPWPATIEIYNPTEELFNKVLTQGTSVVLKAGYQAQPFGTIFEGKIFQPLWERSAVTDFKLTLLCYAGLAQTVANFAVFSSEPGASQKDLIAKMCQLAHTPIPVGTIDTTALPSGTLPRRRAFFGDPRAFIEDVAAANGMQAWYDFKGLNLSKLESPTTFSTLSYGPTTGLVGSVRQTIDGVGFRVLLDPRVTIGATLNKVKIDLSTVRQMPHPYGTYPSILDSDGEYLIYNVRFSGDSRGNEWYADVHALTMLAAKTLLGTVGGKTVDTGATQ